MNINTKLNKANLIFFTISVTILDQITKIISLYLLEFGKLVPINSLLSFQRIYNQNNFMLNKTLPVSVTTHKIIWVLVAIFFILMAIYLIKQPLLQENSLTADFIRTGLLIIIGASLGNAIDVIFRYDGVVDFIRLDFLESLPILNIADIMIYIGELCLVLAWISLLFDKIKKKTNNKTIINQ